MKLHNDYAKNLFDNLLGSVEFSLGRSENGGF
jgi:hypothetical protein